MELLLAQAVAAPAAGIETYTLDEAGDDAADRPIPYVDHGPIQRAFSEHAAQTPERLAIIAPDGRFTYGELEAWANRIAHRLRMWVARAAMLRAVEASPSADRSPRFGRAQGRRRVRGVDPAQPLERLRAIVDAVEPRVQPRARTLRAMR